MSLPTVETVRRRILKVPQQNVKVCLMCGYLFGCRISELISVKSPRDNTVARGPRGTDVRLDEFNGEEVAIFSLKTAKRGGIRRNVALPMNKKFEPWTQYVVHHFQNRNKAPVFPFTRQKVGSYARKTFKGLRYPIEKYTQSGGPGLRKVINAHMRAFNVHALRHVRTTELVEVYGFDGIELSMFGGWTLSSTTGISSSVGRYAHLRWQRYFPKLLRPRP